MKKTISVLLAVLLLFALPGTMYAAENTAEDLSESKIDVPMPRFTYIDRITANLNITSSGLAQCTSVLDGNSSVDSMRISAYLQKNVGSSWSTVKHWSQSYSGNYAVWYKSHYVSSGYQYRLRVYAYMYSGSSVEGTYATDYYTY